MLYLVGGQIVGELLLTLFRSLPEIICFGVLIISRLGFVQRGYFINGGALARFGALIKPLTHPKLSVA